MRTALSTTIVALVLGLPGVAAAETTETTPPAVGNEADYRAALATLSGDANCDHTITISQSFVVAGSTDPTYTGACKLTIEGGGFTLDGGGTSRILNATGGSPGQVTFRYITLTGGLSASEGGAVASNGPNGVVIKDAIVTQNHVQSATNALGGAVRAGLVTVENSSITQNTATVTSGTGSASGGAVYAGGAAVVTDSTISDNTAITPGVQANGGGLFAGTTATVADSTMSGNRAQKGTAAASGFDANGGAIRANGDLTLTRATVTGNVAQASANSAKGGAVFTLSGKVTIDDSTVSSNQAVTADNGNAAEGGAAVGGGLVTITDSTIATNLADSTSSVAGNSTGGAVRAVGAAIEVERSTIHDNEADATVLATGGAFATSGANPITITDSLMTQNAALSEAASGASQGGATAAIAAKTTITRSELRGNSATATFGQGRGGAVNATSSGASVEVLDSALLENEATTFGGAVYGTGGALDVVNSTVTGNSAVAGGGLHNSGGALTLTHATVASNTATTQAANVYSGSGGLVAEASVVADPVTTDDCAVFGPGTASNGHNVESGTSCGFDEIASGDVQSAGSDAVALGPARLNGGAERGDTTEAAPDARSTPTAFPLSGSILIDAIPPESCSAAPELADDQRGISRPFGSGCDIGAIEAAFGPHGFTDSIPFYEATIRWVTSEVNTPRILNGFPDNTFGPGLNITRGDAARLYYRAAGAPDVSGLDDPFADVTPFYRDAVKWAEANDIFDGFADDTFRQDQPISRGNFTRSLYGFVGNPPPGGDHGFTDVIPFYEDSVRWAKNNSLADGFADNTYRTANNITRGNTARIFYNTAQTPTAWDTPETAPDNMLFRNNLPT